MGKYFTIDELTASNVAKQQGIDNTPGSDVVEKLEKLIDSVLDPAREMWGKPLHVNSGYRCPELNKAVGGKSNSQHLRGEAADITTGSKDGNRKLFLMLGGSEIPFDQLIDECDYSWIHVSCSEKMRRGVLHL